jgi:protein-S-isoprenylcysteine O-methyltransferase
MQLQSLALIFLLSEVGLLLFRRSGGRARAEDGGSLRRLWLTICASIVLGMLCTSNVPAADSLLLRTWAVPAVGIFTAGALLRWYSILYLGRFFTVDVAIATDHRVVDTGPYRYVRHPSYSGCLLMFLGLGLLAHNWLSLALIGGTPLVAFLHRIRIEEAALRSSIGTAYDEYCARTRRLVPWVY